VFDMSQVRWRHVFADLLNPMDAGSICRRCAQVVAFEKSDTANHSSKSPNRFRQSDHDGGLQGSFGNFKSTTRSYFCREFSPQRVGLNRKSKRI
jgi:hypothetical protein